MKLLPSPLPLLLILTNASIFSCSSDTDSQPDCQGDKCDAIGDVLDDRSDPIALYLKAQNMKSDSGKLGLLKGDYASVLQGVAEIQQCATNTYRTFILSDDLFRGPGNGSDETQARIDATDCDGLSDQACDDKKREICELDEAGETDESGRCVVTFPRIVSTVCTGNKAAEFFISAPEESQEKPGEFELQFIEMFAWDPITKKYNFYETFPSAQDGGLMAVNATPTRCAQCHLTPTDHDPSGMHMTPIMNELKRPWTHWFGGGFGSHRFLMPPRALQSESHAQLIAPYQAPAADLQTIIERGQFNVEKARLGEVRLAGADWQKAMHTLRPLFCNEQINYTTLKGNAVQMDAILNPSIGARLSGLNVRGLPWQAKQFIEFPTSGLVEQIPVRGNADILLETQMLAFPYRFISHEQALRVHALDWQEAAFSGRKCEVWTTAWTTFAGSPPDLSAAAAESEKKQMAATIKVVMDEILKRFPITNDGKFLAISTSDVGQSIELLSEEELLALECSEINGTGACMVTPQEFGNLIQQYVDELENSNDGINRLAQSRGDRVCHVVQQTDIEVAPDFTKAVSPRFNLDINQCAADCCNGKSLTEGSGFLSFREECERNVQLSLTSQDPDARDTEEGRCSLDCLPARFANRPGLPNMPIDCPGHGGRDRGLFPSCSAGDLRQLLDCSRDSNCELEVVASGLDELCRTCALASSEENGGDLLKVVSECDSANR